MAKLVEIEGIGEVYAGKLREQGIDTQAQLLAKCASPAGRRQLEEGSGISGKLILKWANRADLARISGVGEEYADLLEHSGVDTVPELAQRNAGNLHAKMEEVNAAKNLVRSMPSESQVSGWVEQARGLDRVLEY